MILLNEKIELIIFLFLLDFYFYLIKVFFVEYLKKKFLIMLFLVNLDIELKVS